MFNKISILKFEIISGILIMIFGTLLHFTFELSNNNLLIGTFSAINESTWEHLKLLFFPMLITTIIGYFYLKPKEEYKNFLCAKTVGILSALAFVVVFFYTYTGIIGTNFAILDIGIFFVGVFLGEYIAYKLTYQMSGCKDGLAAFILIVLFICFIVFTYNAPQIGLFRDPLINITK